MLYLYILYVYMFLWKPRLETWITSWGGLHKLNWALKPVTGLNIAHIIKLFYFINFIFPTFKNKIKIRITFERNLVFNPFFPENVGLFLQLAHSKIRNLLFKSKSHKNILKCFYTAICIHFVLNLTIFQQLTMLRPYVFKGNYILKQTLNPWSSDLSFISFRRLFFTYFYCILDKMYTSWWFFNISTKVFLFVYVVLVLRTPSNRVRIKKEAMDLKFFFKHLNFRT